MKKKIILIIITIVFTTTINAQHSKRRSGKSDMMNYYAFSIGPAFPLGDFKDNDPLSDKAGWAITGINISLAQIGIKLSPMFGITGQLMVGANRFDVSSSGISDNDAYWVYSGLMVGPLLSLPAGDNFEINVRPVIGYGMVASPELNSNSGGVVFESDQVAALCFDLGASFCYNLKDNFGLTLGLDYYSTKPDFSRGEISFTQQISTFSTSLGALIRF